MREAAYNANGIPPGDIKAGYGFESDNLYDADWFFFHTDHLGSTSYLTDTAGNVSQFVCYTPYGEAIVDEHLTTYENPFKFSGKELDDITGLYDHGARSRNPVSTLWYGVDPLFEKYPDFSPYNYCAGNPVVYVDPDGKNKYLFKEDGSIQVVEEKGEHYGYVEGKNIKFKFADPINDPAAIDRKEITSLEFISNEQIDNALWNSGVEDFHLSSFYYAYKQSNAGTGKEDEGYMDYTINANLNRGKIQEKGDGLDDQILYLSYTKDEGYVAHNGHNFGNFLWGAGMNSLNINLEDAVLGAHANNYYYDTNSPHQLDSVDDQFSIKCGYKWYSEHHPSFRKKLGHFIKNSSDDSDFETGTNIAKSLWGK